MIERGETTIFFDEFEVDLLKRRLFKHGQIIHLKPKTFDLLLTLIERHGEILSKNDLLDLVWENQFIEENNLTVHVAALRKALGETKDHPRFIVTVPSRGYRFIGKLNASPTDEIVIESKQIQRITIENGEEEGREEIEGEKGRRGEGEKKLGSGLTKFLLFSSSPLLLFLLIGGYFVWQNNRKTTAVFQVASIKRLTTSGRVGLAVALSPDGKLFAYSLREGNNKESLWLGHTDGGEQIQILPPTEMVFWSLSFAPDVSSLYYTTSPDNENGTLYRLPVFGGAPEKVKNTGRGAISFAPDRKRFVFGHDARGTAKTTLKIANIENTDEQEISLGNFNMALQSPAWSPDGETIAVAGREIGAGFGGGNIFLVNVSNGEKKQLTDYGWSRINSVKWLNDGSGLVVVATGKDSSNPQVWQVSASSGEVSRIVTDLNSYSFAFGLSADSRELLTIQILPQTNIWIAPSDDLTRARQITFGSVGRNEGGGGVNWTADGRILYTAVVDNNNTIWTMDADGKNQKQLIPSGGNNICPSASRDGRFIVFQSNRSGKYAIWRADANGENLVQLTGKVNIAGEPTISPDGKWVVFVTSGDFLGALYRISIDGGEPVRLAESTAAWPSVSPDGQFVACGYEVNGTMRLAFFSIDGGAPLKVFDMPRLALLRPGVRWLPDGKNVSYGDTDNGIWEQNLDSGTPQRLTDLPSERIYSHGWSPNGELLAFTRGPEIRDVVLLENAK